jgi:peptide/nickel transport system permease protein
VHLALPALVLGVSYVAYFMRYTRSSMLEAMSAAYMTTADSKGLLPRTVIGRHALRNALIPVVTVIGLSLPSLVGGAVIVESVFNWPGMGLLLIQAVAARDFQVIMGISLFIGVAVVLANLITDVAYAVIDPRIRY